MEQQIKIKVTSSVPEKHCYKYDAGCSICWMGDEGLMHSMICDEVECFPAIFSFDENAKEGYICKDHLEKCQKDDQFEVEI